ncbi:MAG TPA: thiamine-phosphate kinase [Egibacteraceae bacterium]
MSSPAEFALIARLAPHLAASGDDLAAGAAVVVGSGDDAAVLRLGDGDLCVAVDVVVDGVHVRRDLSSPADVGWKAVAVNCSDLAAMGATPLAAVVGLCRPPSLPAADVEALYAGAAEAGRRWGLALVGGDTTRAEQLSVSVTVLGTVARGRAVTRAGARPGDVLVCAGALGAAAAALTAVAAGQQPPATLLAAHRRPRALVEAGRALAAAGATAMIDVSDGLGADVGHVCEASGVRALLRWEDLPLAPGAVATARAAGADPVDVVVGGGEDYALVAAVPPERAAAAVSAARDAGDAPVAVVGEVLPAGDGPRVALASVDGTIRDVTSSGWDHYADRPDADDRGGSEP